MLCLLLSLQMLVQMISVFRVVVSFVIRVLLRRRLPPPAAETKSQSPGARPVHLPTGGAGGAPLIMAEDEIKTSIKTSLLDNFSLFLK